MLARRTGHCGAELEYVPSRGPARTAGRVTGRTRARRWRLRHPRPAGYWCPMHAAVRAAVPGQCPQCGMALVPVTPEVEGRYSLDVEWLPHGRGGGSLRLVVREPRAAAIARRFESVHDRPFHLFVVRDDLQEFSTCTRLPQPDGSLELSGVSLRSAPYQLYADFLPAGGTPQLVRKAIFPARGGTDSAARRTPHLARDSSDKTDHGLRVRIEPDAGTMSAGSLSLIAFHLEDAATGAPVSDLEPYLAAWGHAFIVSADLGRRGAQPSDHAARQSRRPDDLFPATIPARGHVPALGAVHAQRTPRDRAVHRRSRLQSPINAGD